MAFNLAEERAAAEAVGQQVVVYGQREGRGVVYGGHVLVDVLASDDEITRTVFEAKYGRSVLPQEELLMSLVEARSAQD
jgi:hypothetical protein